MEGKKYTVRFSWFDQQHGYASVALHGIPEGALIKKLKDIIDRGDTVTSVELED